MSQGEFLLEVGTEEIPDWMIGPALNDLERRFRDALEKHGLGEGVACTTEATPRRLVLIAENLPSRQPDREETLKGPPRSVAFDAEGKPTKAAEGFARRAGVPVESLRAAAVAGAGARNRVEAPEAAGSVQVGEDEKLVVTRTIEGRPAADILAEVLPEVILGIHFPKTMYWTAKTGPRFIRPIRWLLALLEGQIVPFEIAGVQSGNLTMGHRRLGKMGITVQDARDFEQRLQENYVLLRAPERREKIQAECAALMPPGKRPRRNPRLLENLVQITEYPTPILGGFEPEYLDLPEEVLETVMQHHQKYFAVEDESGRLEPLFVAVANLHGDPQGVIRQGHERVLRARFKDAQFFWENDQKRKLARRLDDLKGVTFQADLGSYFEKTQRNCSLVKQLAETLHLSAEETRNALRAAELAKCDLTTELVGEFPELQGIVGGLYARRQGEPPEVADAIYDHYRPAGAEDAIPRSQAGLIVSIADKLDTLGGFFRLGMIPSGSKDPFALRRACYGIIQMILKGPLDLSIGELCRLAEPGGNREALREFFVDRLRYHLRDVQGYNYDEVNSVLAASADEPLDVAERVKAIHGVRPTPDFEPLAVSFKRIKNILKQAGGIELFASRKLDPSLLEDGAERDLYTEFQQKRSAVAQRKENRDYLGALTEIASLRPAVDRFFDDVLVMTDDENIRQNRLTFLAQLLREFSTIADFAEMASA